MLAFSNDYYGMIFRATQSVELFCAYYEIMKVKLNPKHYNSKFLVFEDEATLREDNRL